MRLFIAFGATLAMLFSLPAAASDQAGTVTDVYVSMGADALAFRVSGTRTTRPACATEDVWALESPNSDNGKALLSALLTAYSIGRNIEMHGTGTCNTVIPTRENIAYIRLH